MWRRGSRRVYNGFHIHQLLGYETGLERLLQVSKHCYEIFFIYMALHIIVLNIFYSCASKLPSCLFSVVYFCIFPVGVSIWFRSEMYLLIGESKDMFVSCFCSEFEVVEPCATQALNTCDVSRMNLWNLVKDAIIYRCTDQAKGGKWHGIWIHGIPYNGDYINDINVYIIVGLVQGETRLACITHMYSTIWHSPYGTLYTVEPRIIIKYPLKQSPL